MERQNLWGNLGNLETIRTPGMILREQGELLEELTNEILYGEVERLPLGNTIYISFNLVAPEIQRYRFKIIEVYHNLNLYPLTIKDIVNNVEYEASDESEFINVLRKIFSSTKVQQAIATLISESRAESNSIEV